MTPPNQVDDPRDHSELGIDQILDDIADRLMAGIAVDLESLVGQYPQLETQIREAYPGVRAMFELGLMEKDQSRGPHLHSATHGGTLGDFRILREIGRGGMGVVYEAEQLSLRRRVALKVLSYAGVLDERRLARFKNEAQAAAALKHPNIVSVHFVGSDRAVHFYVMELVNGQSLADLRGPLPERFSHDANEPTASSAETQPIAAIRTKGGHHDDDHFRWVARLGVQAAEALDYAHEMGIVHRDVKPSNLLVDSRGHLWVTDFGLAQIQADGNLTLTGDLVGTPRYMSPEQAQGDRADVDHRTDVYSLGATLYELATGRPPFVENDRQVLLRQIGEQEPVKPHTLDAAIPRDLETVILKAMSKDRFHRYRTAAELASDLKCFLQHRPVRAKRPSIWQRVVMWSRRHPAWVAAVLAIGIVAIIGLSTSTFLISRAHNNVLRERNLVGVQRQRAEANLRLARETLDKLSAEFSEAPLVSRQRVATLQRQFLDKSLQFYEQLAAENGDSPELLEDQGSVHLQIATIANALYQYKPWEDSSRRAIEIFQELADQYPARPEYRANLARAHVLLGYWSDSTGRRVEGRDWERRGVLIYERLVEEYPQRDEYAVELSMLLNDLGDILPDDDPNKLRSYERGLRIARRLHQTDPLNPQHRLALIWNLKDVGANASWQQPEHGVARLREVVDLAEGLCRIAPDRLDYRHELAMAYLTYSHVLMRAGEEAASDDWFAKAEAVRLELLELRPAMTEYKKSVANTYFQKSIRAYRRGDNAAAESSCRRALELSDSMITSIPELAVLREELSRNYSLLGRILTARRRDAEAETAYQQAFQCLAQASEGMPHVDFQPARAACSLELAWFRLMAGDQRRRDAEEALRLAEDGFTVLVRPGSRMWTVLGIAYFRNSQWQQALSTFDQALRDEWYDERVVNLFKAMALWQMGDRREAGELYAHVVDNVDPGKPRSYDADVALSEARELITGTPSPPEADDSFW